MNPIHSRENAEDLLASLRFFDLQQEARKKSRRLYLLYGLGILGTILTFYLLVSIFFLHSFRIYFYQGDFHLHIQLWHPLEFWILFAFFGISIPLVSWSKVSEFKQGGAYVATQLGGRPLLPLTQNNLERKLRNVVEEIAIASGAQVPEIYILDKDPTLNAFAAGYWEEDAVIGVTRGTLEYLNREELQGVIAHEFSHILNGDVRIRTRLIGLSFGFMFPISIGLAPLRFVFSGSLENRFILSRFCWPFFYLPFILLFCLASLILGCVSYFFGLLVQLAVTRQREKLADASAVEYTRNPQGLAQALKKIGAFSLRHRLGLPTVSPEFAPLFIADGAIKFWQTLLSTHPPLEGRIQKLDPSFDGNFRLVPLKRAQDSADYYVELSNQDIRRITTEATPLVERGPLLPQVAGLSAEEVQEILQNIPEETLEWIREPLTTVSLIYALALDSKDSIRDKQCHLLSQTFHWDIASQVNTIYSSISTLSSFERLTIASLAMPSLRQMSKEQFQLFEQTLHTLIQADERVDLFEYCFLKRVQRILSQFFLPEVKYLKNHKLSEYPDECALILSILAHEDSVSEDETRAAFDLGATLLNLGGAKIHLLTKEQCTRSSLESALDNLSHLGPLYRKNLLFACGAVIAATQDQVTDRERDLLCLLNSVLDA